MMSLTQDELARLQRYVSMAQDMQLIQRYNELIRKTEVAMQSQYPAPSEERKEHLQKQIETCKQVQKDIVGQFPDKYGVRVQNMHSLSREMKAAEPLVERAYHLQQADLALERAPSPLRERFLANQEGRQTVQDYLRQHHQAQEQQQQQPSAQAPEPATPRLPPPELVNQAYTLMQADRQRRSDVSQQQWGSNPSTQEPAERVLEKRLDHAEQTAESRQQIYEALSAHLSEQGQEQLAQQVRDSQQQAQNIQAQRHLQERNAQRVEQMPQGSEQPRPNRLSSTDFDKLKEQYRQPPPQQKQRQQEHTHDR